MLCTGRAVWCYAFLLTGLTGCALCGSRPGCPSERTEAQAGCPSQVACYAHPADNGRYVGYEVGGGAAVHRDGPCREDGTWGWDYLGHCLPSRILLDWFHGTHDQGGPGAYKTDGPRPLEAIENRHQQ
jgi:hypothetical protein